MTGMTSVCYVNYCNEVDWDRILQEVFLFSARCLGAKIGWVYDLRDDSYCLVLQYWAKIKTKCFAVQKIIKSLLFYTAGFKSRNRGRHWDRKRN